MLLINCQTPVENSSRLAYSPLVLFTVSGTGSLAYQLLTINDTNSTFFPLTFQTNWLPLNHCPRMICEYLKTFQSHLAVGIPTTTKFNSLQKCLLTELPKDS